MNETTQILKVDEAGRVRTPREKQEAVLNEFERSGMTGMQFARHVGVRATGDGVSQQFLTKVATELRGLTGSHLDM